MSIPSVLVEKVLLKFIRTMNNCILMAEIIQDPQLRYTAESQIPIAEMIVQFPSLRQNDPPSTLKVVGWGNLAQEMSQRYHHGDRVILEGTLGMVMIERPEGFKEKRAELTVRRVFSAVGTEEISATPAPGTTPTSPTTPPSNVVPLESRTRQTTPTVTETPAPSQPAPPPPEPSFTPAETSTDLDNPDYDPIPF